MWFTVIACRTTCGSVCCMRRTIDFRQSLQFFGLAAALSQISMIRSHDSPVFVSLVALSVCVGD